MGSREISLGSLSFSFDVRNIYFTRHSKRLRHFNPEDRVSCPEDVGRRAPVSRSLIHDSQVKGLEKKAEKEGDHTAESGMVPPVPVTGIMMKTML
jgi:hypothetical protein